MNYWILIIIYIREKVFQKGAFLREHIVHYRNQPKLIEKRLYSIFNKASFYFSYCLRINEQKHSEQAYHRLLQIERR